MEGPSFRSLLPILLKCVASYVFLSMMNGEANALDTVHNLRRIWGGPATSNQICRVLSITKYHTRIEVFRGPTREPLDLELQRIPGRFPFRVLP